MTDDVVQTEEQQMASVMAGYAPKARADEAPAEKTPDPAPSVPEEAPAAEPEPAVAEPDVKTLAEELKALKAKVSSTAGEPEMVRRLHGEIGNINRTLKALQNPARPTPDDDELSTALAGADRAAEEYPELAGPLVKALKLSMSRTPKQTKPEDITELVSSEVAKLRQADAMEALMEDHPDYYATGKTPEFQSWLATKPPEYQEKFNNTWNPAVVAKGLDEFKDSLKVKAKKQDRLTAAITPQGVPQQAKSSTLPDEEGFSVGYYQKGRKRL